MPDYPAQLGQGPNINLGGYVPAPVRNTSLQREVIQSMLEQLGGRVAGAAVDQLTAPPDQTAAINAANTANASRPAGSTLTPVNFQQPSWYQRPNDPNLLAQYSMSAPLAHANVRNVNAEAGRTEAGTPYVAPQAEANIGLTRSDANLNVERQRQIAAMTQAERDAVTETAKRTKAEADRINLLAPEEAASTRAGTAKTTVEAKGQAAHNEAGFGAAQVGLLNEQAKDVASQSGARTAEASKTKAQTQFAENTYLRTQTAALLAAFDNSNDAKKAQNEFVKLNGVLPADGDVNAYITAMHRYMAARVQ